MSMVKWTATRIDAANYCRMRYWLKYVEHCPEIRLSAFAKGSAYHELIEKFWPCLGESEEEVRKTKNKKNGKKYWNSESFSKYAMGKWSQIIMQDNILRNKIKHGAFEGNELERVQERLIAWTHKKEPWEIKSQIGANSKLLFDILLNEGRPLYSELKFDFVLRDLYFSENPRNIFDIWFSGIIDEVRLRDGKVVIRDYKSGKPWIDNMKLNYDPQLSFYNAGLCSLTIRDDDLAQKLGLIDKRREYLGNPLFIDPDFIEEFFMIEAPLVSEKMIEKNPNTNLERLPKVIYSSNRRDEHFFELIKMIKGIEEAVSHGNIYLERGRKCDYCNLKTACENKLKDAISRGPVEENGQNLFDFTAVTYERELVTGMGRDSISRTCGQETNAPDGKKIQRRFNYRRKTSY